MAGDAEFASGAQACLKEDPDLFYREDAASLKAAKAVCARCPVLEQCRDWAVETGEPHGVWGGLDEDERRVRRGGKSRRDQRRRGTKVAA